MFEDEFFVLDHLVQIVVDEMVEAEELTLLRREEELRWTFSADYRRRWLTG